MRQYQRYCPCSAGTAGLAACMAWVASEPQDSTEFTSTPSPTVGSSKFYHFIKLGFFLLINTLLNSGYVYVQPHTEVYFFQPQPHLSSCFSLDFAPYNTQFPTNSKYVVF